MTLRERIHQRRRHLTKKEAVIAAYLEAGYPHAGLETAAEIGRRTDTSAATVVRFISKLGYDGYPDFQRDARETVEARLTTPLFRLDDRVNVGERSTAKENVLRSTFETSMSALAETLRLVDEQLLESIARALVKCPGRIIIVGEKRAHSLAIYLQAMLGLLLKRVSVLSSDSGFAADQLMDIGPDDVLIALDLRRYIEGTCKAARWAEQRGATVILFTDAPNSPLSGVTTYKLQAEAPNCGIFDSYVGIMMVMDVLLNLVVATAPEAARQRLQLGETAWKNFEIFAQVR